jgi:hypothetical protein
MADQIYGVNQQNTEPQQLRCTKAGGLYLEASAAKPYSPVFGQTSHSTR